jgi:hypothetical protein
LYVVGGEKEMKTKGLVIVLILAVMLFTAKSVYSGNKPPGSTFGPIVKAHPWEEIDDNSGPTGSSAMILKNDHKIFMIPIFSDFLIWVYIKDIRKGSDHQGSSININDKSYQYQIIFPW